MKLNFLTQMREAAQQIFHKGAHAQRQAMRDINPPPSSAAPPTPQPQPTPQPSQGGGNGGSNGGDGGWYEDSFCGVLGSDPVPC